VNEPPEAANGSLHPSTPKAGVPGTRPAAEILTEAKDLYKLRPPSRGVEEIRHELTPKDDSAVAQLL